MGKICIVRHGETDWNRLGRLQGQTDIALNETGRMQSEQLGEYLKRYNWKHVFSSPLIRAYETAVIIAETIGISIVKTDDALRERDYGAAEGTTPEERSLIYPDRNYPGQEDWHVLRDRVYKSIITHAGMCLNDDVIFVSHGAAINSILYTLSNGEYGSGITQLGSACLNLLVYENGILKVEYYNKSVKNVKFHHTSQI